MNLSTHLFVALCTLGNVIALGTYDVTSGDESFLTRLKADKFPPFELCTIEGETPRGYGLYILKLIVNVRYVDDKNKDVNMLMTVTDLKGIKLPITFKISGFNVDLSWNQDQLKNNLKSEMVCGLFDALEMEVHGFKHYFVKYYKQTTYTWWEDAFKEYNDNYEYEETNISPILEQEYIKRRDSLQNLDVTRIEPSALKSLKTDKFPPFELCKVRGVTFGSGLTIIYKLLVNIKFVDDTQQNVKMLITATDVENKNIPGTYEIPNFNVNPRWNINELTRQLQYQMICGLFDAIIIDDHGTKYYILKYFEISKQKWWGDVYNQNDNYKHVETDECPKVEKKYIDRSRGHA